MGVSEGSGNRMENWGFGVVVAGVGYQKHAAQGWLRGGGLDATGFLICLTFF